MLDRIDWPRAIVICVLALVVGTLQYTGKLPPEWAAAIASLVVLVAGALKSFLGAVKPPPLPLLFLLMAGCATVDRDVADGVYAGQQVLCVEKSATLPDSKTCRHDVDVKWGRADGGKGE